MASTAHESMLDIELYSWFDLKLKYLCRKLKRMLAAKEKKAAEKTCSSIVPICCGCA
jgi:hypothetical protein